MSPQLTDTSSVEQSLREALRKADNSQTKYHIREALQMTKLDH